LDDLALAAAAAFAALAGAFAEGFDVAALVAGAAFARATNRPVEVRGRAAAAADRGEAGFEIPGFVAFDGALAAAAFAAGGFAEAGFAAGVSAAAGFAAARFAVALGGVAVDRVAGGADAEAIVAEAVDAGAVDVGADVAFAFAAVGRAGLGRASRAASAEVALASWSRRFSSLARAFAIALSRFTSASARRNDSVAAFFLAFFAMDMTLPA
jgi:hypothetical protein